MTITKQALIAANRFGYGASQQQLLLAKDDPKQWLRQQLTPVVFDTSLPSFNDMAGYLADYQKKKKQQKMLGKSYKRPKEHIEAIRQLTADSTMQAITMDNSISWRLLDFFSNHFSVSAQGQKMSAIAPTLEREAIGPNLLGSFNDLLMSVIKHPAMLVYLNNEKSAGNNSKLARKGRGLNENLAREILELHTLGVNGGYSQQDVIALANGISGWSLKRPKNGKRAGFVFRRPAHEPGSQTLLGITYRQRGLEQGEAMLEDLAKHPATSRYVCTKLATHFISDTPSPVLVEKLVQRWQQSNGNIKQVMLALIDADESWQGASQKFKTPRDFVISSLRFLKAKPRKSRALIRTLSVLGQQPFKAGSPAGYGDTASHWDGANALMARIDWAAQLANSRHAKKLSNIEHQLKALLSSSNYTMVMRAESRQQSLALALMSPEFQRR